MFAGRYFPSRYFPDRYWPKVGATAADGVVSSTGSALRPAVRCVAVQLNTAVTSSGAAVRTAVRCSGVRLIDGGP